MSSIATLGGYYVLGRKQVSWDLVTGAKPHRQFFELLRSDAEALMAEQAGFPDPQNPGEGVELVWQIAGGPIMKAQKLYPIALKASDIPQTLLVEVVDIRHWWAYQHISRVYNQRRRVGTQRLHQDGGPLETQPLAPVVAYWPWTLKNVFRAKAQGGDGKEPWLAKDVVIDVMDAVTGGSDRYRIEPNLVRDVPIEGVQVNDNGQDAVRRVLAFLGAAAVFVDYDGTAWIFDTRDGREELLVPVLVPMAGGPLPARVSHRLTRPCKVRCLMTRRIELRLDSVPEVTTSAQAAQTASLIQSDTDLRVYNVAPVPDVFLRIGQAANDQLMRQNNQGRTVTTGNWEPLTALFDGWAQDRQTGQLWDIDADHIRATWLDPGLLQSMVQGLHPDASEVLARRLACARGHFRATWQMEQGLLDRLASVEACRIAILDPVNGTRASSPAYLDWTALYAIRGPNRPGENSLELMKTFIGYPGSQTTPLLLGKRAPFSVTMLDPEQGVFHITPLTDPTGAVVSYVPGRLEGPNGGPVPVADPKQGQAGGSGTIMRDQAHLATGFQVAVILTVIAGAPNDEARFHVEEIFPRDIEKIIGRSLGPCDGPAMDVSIGPELITANVAWEDSQAVVSAIKGALGMRPFGDPNTLVPVNKDDLGLVAQAAAVQVYMAEVDRIEGGITGAINPSVRPIGSVSRVSHGLSPDGVATTSVSLPADPPPVDLVAYLDERHRRRLLGLVDPKSVVR